MLFVVTEPCCVREPFEEHQENCFFKRQKREIDEFIEKLLKDFKKAMKEDNGEAQAKKGGKL